MRVVLRQTGRAIGRAGDAGLVISAVAVVAITVLTTVEVVARNVFAVSTLIVDEAGAYLLVVVTFLGLAWTLRTHGFIRIDTYRMKLPGRARLALDLAIHGLAATYTAVLDWYLWQFTRDAYRFGTTAVQITQTPLWIPYSAMLVGGLLLLLEILAGACRVALGEPGASADEERETL